MIRETKGTVEEVIAAILLYGIVCELIIVLFVREDMLFSFLGMLVGIVLSVGSFIHMAYSIENALRVTDMGASTRMMRKSTAIRYVVYLGAVVIAYLTGFFNIVAMIIGLFSLKFGAYMQPVMHKLFVRRRQAAGKEE